MIKGISFYGNYEKKLTDQQFKGYLETAVGLGFNTVFTTIHLPETSVEQQIFQLGKTVKLIHSHKLQVLLDVSGPTIKKIIADNELKKLFLEMKIEMYRFDCDYRLNDILTSIAALQIQAVALNASSLSETEIETAVKTIQKKYPEVKLWGCHNFYPRPQTGLNQEFIAKQNQVFQALDIPVVSFLPVKQYARGPLFQGLVTIEEHRDQDMEKNALSLAAIPGFGGLIIADNFAEAAQLKTVADVCDKEPLTINLIMSKTTDKKVLKKLLNKKQRIRYDSGDYVLRLESSRAMASQGDAIDSFNTISRNRYDITIDNEKYGRYSGEIQIVLRSLPADEKVNVIGYIAEVDQYKIEYIGKGREFYFQIKTE